MLNTNTIRKICVFLFLSSFLGGCATAPSGIVRFDEVSLKTLCESHNIKWMFDSVSQVVTLARGNENASVLIGSDVVLVNDEYVTLSSSVRRYSNSIVVPLDFEQKVISRLKTVTSHKIYKFNRIVIDPGHGGKDPGATGRSGLKEKVVVLDVSKRLKRVLEKRGFDVVLTRTSDKFLTLEERTEAATKAKPDLFVSIHANANRTRRIYGFEVYYPRPRDKVENNIDQLKKNEKTLYRNLSMKKNVTVQSIVSDMLNNYKEAESKSIAKHVSKKSTMHIGAKNRGAMEAGYFVIRNSIVPAILVEMGYLSNLKEEKLLKTSLYRQKVAEGIAKSITDYVSK